MSDPIKNLPSHVHPTISRIFDAIATSVPRGDGSFPGAAPSTFLDTKGNPITLPSDEWSIELRGNPGGQSMVVKVRPHNGPMQSIEGVADLPALLASLGTTVGGISSGTATLVASTIDVVVPVLSDGDPAVPAGSVVYASVTTAAGKAKLLSAVRKNDNEITISSTGSGYGALLEAAGVAGTLVAGTVDSTLANVAGDRLQVTKTADGGTPGSYHTVERVNDTTVRVKARYTETTAQATLIAGAKDITLTNAVGDKLSVDMETSGGTPGVLSVKRKNATEVTVQSWLAGTGIEELDISVVNVRNHGPKTSLDTSTVKTYNFGQAAHETSLVRWAVVRPN